MPRGGKLKYICDIHGLEQFVRQVPRGSYLLDSILSDDPAEKVKLDTKNVDHSSLVGHVSDGFEERKFGVRHI